MQPVPYIYHGKKTSKQFHSLCDLNQLDKERVAIDFNESIGEKLYLFSQSDIINDSSGNDIEIVEGLKISVFDFDKDENGNFDNLLADGIVERNTTGIYMHVK